MLHAGAERLLSCYRDPTEAFSHHNRRGSLSKPGYELSSKLMWVNGAPAPASICSAALAPAPSSNPPASSLAAAPDVCTNLYQPGAQLLLRLLLTLHPRLRHSLRRRRLATHQVAGSCLQRQPRALMSLAKPTADILSFADLMDAKSFSKTPFTTQPMYIAACAFSGGCCTYGFQVAHAYDDAASPTSRLDPAVYDPPQPSGLLEDIHAIAQEQQFPGSIGSARAMPTTMMIQANMST